MTPKDQKKRLERAARKEANKVAATHFHTGEFRLNLALDIRDTMVDFALLAERRGRREAAKEAAELALGYNKGDPGLYEMILTLAKRSPRKTSVTSTKRGNSRVGRK